MAPRTPHRDRSFEEPKPHLGPLAGLTRTAKVTFNINERTMGRILVYLEKRGRIESMASFLARLRWRKVKRRKTLCPCARRRAKGNVASSPGDLVQANTLTVTLGPGKTIKNFSAVDLFTRFSLAEVHTRGHGEPCGRLPGAPYHPSSFR